MKHRRAGPAKGKNTGRRKVAVPPRAKAKAVPFPKKPKAKPKTRVPKPIGPWAAMRALLAKATVKAPVIFDVGAHFGNVTAYLLKMWPYATVYCFEPEPLSLERLHARFDDDERVVIVPSALGSRDGRSKFHLCGQNTEMSSLLPRAEWKGRRYYRHEVRETIQVDVITLDSFMEMEGIEVVHLMKMDVQGGEKKVLQGARDALMNHRIWALYSEVLFVALYDKAALFWELCKQLDKYDMDLFDVYGLQRSWINRQLKYGDALFIGPELRTLVNDYPEEWLRKSLDGRMCPGR